MTSLVIIQSTIWTVILCVKVSSYMCIVVVAHRGCSEGKSLIKRMVGGPSGDSLHPGDGVHFL